MTVGEAIREARKNANKGQGMTQKELADKLGFSYVVISQYENGKRNPKFETLKRIANALEISLRDIISEEDELEGLLSEVDQLIDEKYLSDDVPEWRKKEIIADMKAQISTIECAIKAMRSQNEFEYTPLDLIEIEIDKLNKAGQQIAVERISELTKIPDYRKED